MSAPTPTEHLPAHMSAPTPTKHLPAHMQAHMPAPANTSLLCPATDPAAITVFRPATPTPTLLSARAATLPETATDMALTLAEDSSFSQGEHHFNVAEN